jgi:hypothetical protein
MCVEIDFNELVGYVVEEVLTVSNVIEDRVKLDNDDVYKFEDDVEDDFSVGDEVVVFTESVGGKVISKKVLCNDKLLDVE